MEILQKFNKTQWLAVLVGGPTSSGKAFAHHFEFMPACNRQAIWTN
jgi:hypothetical protein